jgi:Protein of unknown function (DUF2877)
VARWWVPRRPQIRDARSAESHARELAKLVDQAAAPLPGYLTEPHRALAAAITDGDTAAAEAAAVAMLGLGPGLTPSGDDILAGALVTLRALVELEPAVSSLADGVAATVVRAATRRTSLVSAALLHEAAAGRCIPELTSLLDALGSGSPLDHPVAALLRVGHTSGSDLARGVLLALATAAKRSNSC